MKKLYRNIKNGKVYEYLGNVIDATNSTQKFTKVLYIDVESGVKYVRDINEFAQKFEIVESLENAKDSIEYKVIESISFSNLINDVNMHIKNGCSLQGGICTTKTSNSSTSYLQAIVKCE